MIRSPFRMAACLVAAWSAGPLSGAPSAAAQGARPVDVRDEVFAGSEVENYLRWLQLGGESALRPWSIRAFSQRELRRLLPRDSAHPWAGHYELRPDTAVGLRLGLVRPTAQVILNSGFPYGFNDGPIWAGRGLTTAVQAGFSARYGPMSLVVAPMAFVAQNASFPLEPNGRSGKLVYADGTYPTRIDLPQRFGDDPYARLDPGQSTLRIDLPVVTAGVSTADQYWGPAAYFPVILGNNAAGYPHAFVGTSAPLDVGIGRVHGRLVYGILSQSDYSWITGPARRRFMSGGVATFTPRGVDGLELGFTRFFHTPWPRDGLRLENFKKPFEGLLKLNLPKTGFSSDSLSDADDQLASVFMRWAFPRSGVEVYGEYGREDHSLNTRDLLVEPDNSAGYMLGLRKRFDLDESRFVTFQGEVLNLSRSHLNRVRNQAVFYTHFATRQGHTQRGQLLGAGAGYASTGSVVAMDYYRPQGRWTVSWTRLEPGGEGDVMHALGAEALFFRGRFELVGGLTAVSDFSRDDVGAGFDLNSTFQVRVGL